MLSRVSSTLCALAIAGSTPVMAQSNADYDPAVGHQLQQPAAVFQTTGGSGSGFPVRPIFSLSESTVDGCSEVGPECGTADSCTAAGCGVGGHDSCYDGLCDDGFLSDDDPLLKDLRNQELCDGLTYSVGGALRYRFIDERNRLRPPLRAGRSTYNQWRFTPFVELKYNDWITAYAQGIDAATFDEDLVELPIDQNRADMLRYYVDLNLGEIDGGDLHLKAGRQFLKYGSQHLLSPLAWSNTYRNFEGVKGYWVNKDWQIDAFATRPVNSATLNRLAPYSFDTPDQSRWLSAVYFSYLGEENSVFEFYWIWLLENEDRQLLIDGDRHTFGARSAGSSVIAENCGKPLATYLWDYEGGFQVGKEDFNGTNNENIQAGYLSIMSDVRLDQVAWKPTARGVFWYGSGDDNPGDGTNNTVSTIAPLGHAYWGQIDNFNGQNLMDYSIQGTVSPTSKLSINTQFHWFDKASASDAIYNIAGVPFGGVSTTDRTLGNELDLVATYKFNKNLTLQGGYFWFWYGDAVTQNPNATVANRRDAQQFYTYIDWNF